MFASHRSPVVCRRGMVASTQPLASEAGLRVLQEGGNAADAAVAMAAALNVTEPCSTGTMRSATSGRQYLQSEEKNKPFVPNRQRFGDAVDECRSQ